MRKMFTYLGRYLGWSFEVKVFVLEIQNQTKSLSTLVSDTTSHRTECTKNTRLPIGQYYRFLLTYITFFLKTNLFYFFKRCFPVMSRNKHCGVAQWHLSHHHLLPRYTPYNRNNNRYIVLAIKVFQKNSWTLFFSCSRFLLVKYDPADDKKTFRVLRYGRSKWNT